MRRAAEVLRSPPGRADVQARFVDGAFGAAVVEGLDTRRDPADPGVGAWLQAVLWHSGVVCVRLSAKLSDDEHRALVSMIGALKDPVGTDVDGRPLRYSEAKQVIDSGFVMTEELREALGDGSLGGDDQRPGLFEYFHTDDSYVECPAVATVLHARALPPSGGGATSFMDMRAAYESLDPDERDRLVGLRAVHAYDNRGAFPPRASASGPLGRLAEVSHPIVREHPATGRPALYFDLDRAYRIEELPLDEGRSLLQDLQDRAEISAPRYDHQWQPHDVLIWDNAAVQHKAGGDFPVGEPRRFWRYMVEGPRPVGYSPRA